MFNFGVGVYNIITYDSSIFQALSPYWLVEYFREDFGQGAFYAGDALLPISLVNLMWCTDVVTEDASRHVLHSRTSQHGAPCPLSFCHLPVWKHFLLIWDTLTEQPCACQV